MPTLLDLLVGLAIASAIASAVVVIALLFGEWLKRGRVRFEDRLRSERVEPVDFAHLETEKAA